MYMYNLKIHMYMYNLKMYSLTRQATPSFFNVACEKSNIEKAGCGLVCEAKDI